MPRFISPITDIKPLGSVSFFDSNTGAEKITFKDELESEALKNLPEIPVDADGNLPNIFFSGSATVKYIDENDVQYAVRKVGEEAGLGNFTDYSNIATYSINDIVIENGTFYISSKNGNQGNDPTLNPGNNEFWEEWPVNGIYNAKITYAVGDVVQTAAGNFKRSLTALNSNNDPDTDDGTNWVNAIDELWVNKSSAFTVFAEKSYQVDASGGSVDCALKTAYIVGNSIVVHNESISTNTVRLTNTALTIKGKGSTATSADNIVIPAGETAILIAKTTTILESL